MGPISTAPVIHLDDLELRLEGEPGAFSAELVSTQPAPGLHLLRLELQADHAAPPPALRLRGALPIRDSHHAWATTRHGLGQGRQAIDAEVAARACSQAPVICLHSFEDRNRCTLAVDDGLHQSVLRVLNREEDATHQLTVALFERPLPPTRRIVVTVRVDRRDIPYHRALAEVAEWWAAQPGYELAAVPDAARLPMYSTWYSFHQNVPAAAVEAQCRLARALGCESVIMDDGWQTLDEQRGYAFTGDWEPERIPDIAEHVARVHALGMRYLLWYSVPFVGFQAACYPRFERMALRRDERLQTLVLDPRFPEVREYLIGCYERAVRDWDVDGLKLDFVDCFHGEPDGSGGRDLADVDEAVDRLLSDAMDRLRLMKPEIMIEFRQSYIGPKMRRYGNLFRAGDCPYDPLANRVRTLDLRLLCGSTCVHSDMFRWHAEDPVASAALQILAVLFSVPQVSVLIDRLPEDHQRMLGFWLAFWREHRGTLLDGALDPRRPDLGYPVVVAQDAGCTVAAVYAEQVLRLDAPAPQLRLVNASRRAGLVLDLGQDLGERRIVIQDCCGALVSDRRQAMSAGLHRLAVPASGLVRID